MKAAPWRIRVAFALGAAASLAGLAEAAGPTRPQAIAGVPGLPPDTPGLPSGMPMLPGLGETMQRDLATGLALNGFDPVAYRLGGRAVPGSGDLELIHRGAVWRFASAANRAAFRDAPDVYEPAFSGFDAAAVADGAAVESNPAVFAVVGDRLVLFGTRENRDRFLASAETRAQADKRWPEVYQTVAR